MFKEDAGREKQETFYVGDSLFLHYVIPKTKSSAVITLSIAPFREYKQWPFYEELSDRLKGDDNVLNIQNFFPYGVLYDEKELHQGLGTQVMKEKVFPTSCEYNASVIYCNTSNDGMKKVLNKFDFVGMDHYTPDMFGNFWQPWYKLL